MRELFARLKPMLPFMTGAMAACILAYLLAEPLDYTTAFLLATMACLLLLPMMLRFYYHLLLVSMFLPVCVFILKGSPPAWIVMTAVTLLMVALDRAVSGKRPFFFPTAIVAPLIMFFLVAVFTALMTGGFGFRSLGGDVYGGKKYAYLFAGLLSFFAIASRAIPPGRVNLYTALFLLGTVPSFISDLVAYLPSGLHFIYLLFPADGYTTDEMGNYTTVDWGVTRLTGVSSAALGVFMWLMARHGVGGVFSLRRPWLAAGLGLAGVAVSVGGFRSGILQMMLVFLFLFFAEKHYRSRLGPVFVLAAVLGVAVLVPLAAHLPLVIQRSLAFLPLSLNPEAVAAAADSSNWRINMWTSLLGEIPKHFFLGKGYAIPLETFGEMTSSGLGSAGRVDGAQETLALAGDYHNGPISVLLTFGIWGALAFAWLVGASLLALVRNLRYGPVENLRLNRFLLGYYLSKLLIFMTVYGDISSDSVFFCALVGFSLAANHGICRAPQPAQSALDQIVRFKRPQGTPPPATCSPVHLL